MFYNSCNYNFPKIMILSIIVPVYNEEKTIRSVIKQVKDVVLPTNIKKEILIINDGSTDDTAEVLKNYNADAQIKIFHFKENRGKTEAVKYGLALSYGDVILIQDADLEYSPENYSRLITPLINNETLIVYGSRFMGSIKNMKFVIRLANIFSNITFNFIHKTNLTDINTCFKVFKRSVLKDIIITSADFVFETEFTTKMVRAGHKIKEVPISYIARSKRDGKKMFWLKAIRMYWGIIEYFFKKGNQTELKSSLYTKEYYLACNDGFHEFQNGFELSYNKKKELSLLDMQPGLKFLDIGFGRGEMLYHCDKLGADCYGIDYSNDAFGIARDVQNKSPNIKIIQADCSELPFADNSFDRILLADVIEHVTFDKGIKLLREIERVLTPDGLFLLHTSPNVFFMKTIYPLLMLFINSKKREEVTDHVAVQCRVHIHEYHYFSLKKLSESSGLNAQVWIDNDFTRGGTFRHLKDLTPMQVFTYKIVRLLEKCNFFPLKLFLGNDLWLIHQINNK